MRFFLFCCVLFEEVVSCNARGCVASRSIAPLAGNRYKVATTHAQRALLLAKRENYGEGLEGGEELFLQFCDLCFGEFQARLRFLYQVHQTA